MVDSKTREFIRITIRSYLPDPAYKVFFVGRENNGLTSKHKTYYYWEYDPKICTTKCD